MIANRNLLAVYAYFLHCQLKKNGYSKYIVLHEYSFIWWISMSMERPPNPPTDSELIRLAEIALLYEETQGRQDQVVKILGMTQPTVSRLIARATNLGLLSRPVKLSDDPEHVRLFEEARNNTELLARANSWCSESDVKIRQIRVFPTDKELFCSAVARPVGELLAKSKIGIGVSLGRTLASVIHKLRRAEARIDRPIRVVPLSGDPVHLMNVENQQQTASTLAGELIQQAFASKASGQQPVLTGVPCYLPKRFQGEEGKSLVETYIREIPGLNKLFGSTQSDDGIIHQVDTALVGIGVIADNDDDPTQDLQTGVFLREIFVAEQGQDTKNELRRLIDGELAGVLLAKEGLPPADLKTLRPYKRGWYGIREQELHALAKKASVGNTPGVILVARGAAKAEAVRAAIKLGLINHLMIDSKLAEALMQSN
jgi:DNA-binding transcriptional regulator LsrR (DeoR family)